MKYHHDRFFECYKARLVAKGYTHTYRYDYAENHGSFPLLISFTVSLGWLLFQLDVKDAFLRVDLHKFAWCQLGLLLKRRVLRCVIFAKLSLGLSNLLGLSSASSVMPLNDVVP